MMRVEGQHLVIELADFGPASADGSALALAVIERIEDTRWVTDGATGERRLLKHKNAAPISCRIKLDLHAVAWLCTRAAKNRSRKAKAGALVALALNGPVSWEPIE